MSTELMNVADDSGEAAYDNDRETSSFRDEPAEPEMKEDSAVDETALDAERRSLRSAEVKIGCDDEYNTSCGFGIYRPSWLQKFARPEIYAVVLGLIGFCDGANSTYNIGTLSTLEKHLKIPSKTSGFIRSAFEIGAMGTLPCMGYAARHVRPMYLLGGGTMMISIACLCFMLPYLIFGAGPEALALAPAVTNSTRLGQGTDRFCGITKEEECGNDGVGGYSSSISIVILFIANTLLGVANSAHFSVGIAYLDNNSPKNLAPILLATTTCIRMVGPSLGYGLSAFSLSYYINPAVTPNFSKENPRWIGAWWMGWPILASVVAIIGAVVLLFPRRLPQVAKMYGDRLEIASITEERPSLKDFKLTMKRLLRNKVLMYNILSGICLGFGFESYLIFMPKYIETQFRQSASHANVITGAIGLTMTGIGTLAAAIWINRFHPLPRSIAGWNVIVECLAVLGYFSWGFLGCPTQDLHGSLSPDGRWNLTAACNEGCGCGSDVQYAPICSLDGITTFFSPCHGGCSTQQTFTNGTKIFSDCECIMDRMATDGACPIDCMTSFTLFIVTQSIVNFLQATGRAGNVLLTFRCVSEKDKSLAIALGEFTLCLFAFFPAPTVYGAMLDLACLVWGDSCGETGNCWLYDEQTTRYLLNFTAAGSLLIGVIFDVAVWIYCSKLKIYDEDYIQTSPEDNKMSETQ